MHVRHVTCRTLPVKRSIGQSAVFGAAYRAAEKLRDFRQDKTVNYEARSPDVWHKEILAPQGAASWTQDREALWNAAEDAEKRKDGRPARDVTLGLPWGVSREKQEELVRTYCSQEFVDRGHVVDICFHRYGKKVTPHSEEGRATLYRWAEKGVPFLDREECMDLHEPHVKVTHDGQGNFLHGKIFNPHAHAYVTPRALTDDGRAFEGKRNRQFDRHEQAKEWRYGWTNHVNAHLEAEGVDFRVSALAPEGDGALPLKPEDMPLQSYHIEQQGVPSVIRAERDFNAAHNASVRQADASMKAIEAEAAEDAQTGRNSRYERLQLFWSTMRERVSDWGDTIRTKARSYWQTAPEESGEPEQRVSANSAPQAAAPAIEPSEPDGDATLTQPQEPDVGDIDHER